MDTQGASYWKAFLVSLLLAVISGGVSSCSYNSSGGTSMNFPGISVRWGNFPNGAVLAVVLIGTIVLALIIGLVTIAFRIFVVAPFEVGVKQYFKQSAQEDVNMNYVVYSFNRGKYLAIVKGCFRAASLPTYGFCCSLSQGS